MKIILLTFMTAVFFSAPYSKTYAQGNIPTTIEVINKAIETYGGESILREIDNKNNFYYETSSYAPSGEFNGSYGRYFKKPSKIREEMHLLSKQLFITKIYNDGRVYMSKDNKEIETDNTISWFKKMCNFNSRLGILSSIPLLYLLDHQNEVKYIGEEIINNKKCFGLEILIEQDSKAIYFFDSETFLMIKSVKVFHFGNGYQVKRAIYYSDFKKIYNNKITYPFRWKIYRGHRDEVKMAENMLREISFDELDDSLFEIPGGK